MLLSIYLIFFRSIYFLKKILIRKKRSFSKKRYGPLVSFLNLRPKLTLETLEQGGKYVQNVSIVNFEQVNVGWSKTAEATTIVFVKKKLDNKILKNKTKIINSI